MLVRSSNAAAVDAGAGQPSAFERDTAGAKMNVGGFLRPIGTVPTLIRERTREFD